MSWKAENGQHSSHLQLPLALIKNSEDIGRPVDYYQHFFLSDANSWRVKIDAVCYTQTIVMLGHVETMYEPEAKQRESERRWHNIGLIKRHLWISLCCC